MEELVEKIAKEDAKEAKVRSDKQVEQASQDPNKISHPVGSGWIQLALGSRYAPRSRIMLQQFMLDQHLGLIGSCLLRAETAALCFGSGKPSKRKLKPKSGLRTSASSNSPGTNGRGRRE